MMRTGRSSRFPRKGRAGGVRSDSGITTLQVLIMFPIVMIIVMIAVQETLNFYAKEVALAAAQEGVDAIRFSGNPGLTAADEARAETTATTAINGFLTRNNNTFFTHPQLVTSPFPVMTPPSRNNQTAEITVELQGNAVSLIPFLSLSVDQQAWGFVESFSTGFR